MRKDKILLVEDDSTLSFIVQDALTREGFDVVCASNGDLGLKLFKESEPDIIVADVMMPKMDGFEVCQQIREFSNMPIVMLTAKGDDMDKILGLEYGADDYITKPFNILEIKARIKAIMRRTGRRKGEAGKSSGSLGASDGSGEPAALHSREGDQSDRQGV